MVVITHFGHFWILVVLEQLATNVKLTSIVKLFLLSARSRIHWDIACQMLDAHSLLVDQLVKEHGDSIFSIDIQVLLVTGKTLETNIVHIAEILCCWVYKVCFTRRFFG